MKASWNARLRDVFLMTLGIVLVSIGVYFFKFPNNFSMGGVSGLAVILAPLSPWPWLSASAINGVINILFLFLGFAMLNYGFGLRTVYCSILYSLVIQAFEWICPLDAPLTHEKMLELFFAVIFPALGSAILFNINASSGGTDIVAMILKKYTGLDVGKALLLSDVVIAASTFLIFDVETGLFSMLGLVLKSVLVDSVIESLNRRKNFFIITSDPRMACDYITLRLHRGATVWEGEGAYTHENTGWSSPRSPGDRRWPCAATSRRTIPRPSSSLPIPARSSAKASCGPEYKKLRPDTKWYPAAVFLLSQKLDASHDGQGLLHILSRVDDAYNRQHQQHQIEDLYHDQQQPAQHRDDR